MSAATASGGAAQPSGAAAPRAVTRGESPQQAAKVDWINCTFAAPSMSIGGFVGILGRILRRPVSATEAGGLIGFESSVRLHAHHASKVTQIGSLAFGGEQQQGRWLFQLTGVGCAFVEHWDELADLLEGMPDSRITRLDLAVDFLNGEHTVDEAVTLHGMGGFSLAGRPPSTSVAGDWLQCEQGRTLYVGKAANGKSLRVYEKGKQLGQMDSAWVRFEVQFGNRDRVIPFDALTQRDAFFAGAYPALESMVDDASRTVDTKQEGGTVTLAHLWHHLRRTYGKVFDALCVLPGVDVSQLVEEVRVVGTPRRLDPTSLDAGVTAADVIARAKEKR